MLVALSSGAAMADTGTTSFKAKITIQKVCNVNTVQATDLDFGNSSASAAANIDANSTITVKCTQGTAYTLGLTPGNNNSAGAGEMLAQNVAPMTGNNDKVAYTMYLDANRNPNQVWGNQIGTNTKSGTGQGLATSEVHTVYGRVTAAATNVKPDSYLDTVTVTLTY
jgi:spore coat protein U-like protein